jgi:miniconductance mechanosensitive channel
MEEQGVRRIKRSFFIDTTSIKKATAAMHQNYKNSHETNLACFREYLVNYLSNREDICNEQTLMVRLLPASEYGVPVEFYCFAKTIQWTKYEAIQTDIMEHVFVALPKFELVHYQRK